jgi:SAM-dependent methyltransferase
MATEQVTNERPDVRTAVRERYGQVAEKGSAAPDPCCAPGDSGCCGGSADEAVQLQAVQVLYEDPDVASLPAEVTDLSLGCGDPVTLASLQPGQTVLDLGSGGGIDCFLAARKVGPMGRVIGVDMTPAMIDRARANQAKLGLSNVEFRLGEIEHLPVADNTVDVILSNCVINLSPDKAQVFREAYRVLRPGGRLAVSDIVTDGPLPDAVKNDLAAWAGCIGGALDAREYVAGMEAAGFVDVTLTPVYWDREMMDAAVAELEPEAARQVEAARAAGKRVAVDAVSGSVVELDETAGSGAFEQPIFSAKITAHKPA